MTYKLLFAGLGSIGKRHLKNTVAFLKSRGDDFVIDCIRSGSSAMDPEVSSYIRKSYTYQETIVETYDVLFVTNPTSKHYETIQNYNHVAKHMFIEKPVFDRDDLDASELNLDPFGVYYVACPLRYNAVLQYVKAHVDCSNAIAVRSISSSYLPDWRPNQDYRSVYSAHRDMGGGVAIDLVHEWDYLTWLFQKPEQVCSIIGTHSALEIDSDDLAIYIGKRGKLSYELHLDYFGRSTIRQLQIFMPTETIEADISKGEIRYLKSGEMVTLAEDRNEYQIREIRHFFDIVEGSMENDNTIENAISNLKLARGEI